MIQKVIRLYSRLRSYWSIVRPVYYRVSTKTTSPAINAGVGEVGERTTGAEDLESAVFDTARPCLSDPYKTAPSCSRYQSEHGYKRSFVVLSSFWR
jgi:hypothetical protein